MTAADRFTADVLRATVDVLDARLTDALTYLRGDHNQFDGYALTAEGVAFLITVLEGCCDEGGAE